mmetsp:Transcript_31904/g.79996  ORF Transcript_31904/g.79996 Transcript_31904/m.79996 type:complete len:203 (-) Transcript_31904:2276-2884(-)
MRRRRSSAPRWPPAARCPSTSRRPAADPPAARAHGRHGRRHRCSARACRAVCPARAALSGDRPGGRRRARTPQRSPLRPRPRAATVGPCRQSRRPVGSLRPRRRQRAGQGRSPLSTAHRAGPGCSSRRAAVDRRPPGTPPPPGTRGGSAPAQQCAPRPRRPPRTAPARLAAPQACRCAPVALARRRRSGWRGRSRAPLPPPR